MKILYSILAGLMLLLSGCAKEDKTIEQQNASILNYVNSLPQGSYVLQDGVYKVRVFTNKTAADPVIAKGDSVYVYYAGYPYAAAVLASPFTTNIESVADEALMDKALMNFSAKGLKIGDTNIVKGVDRGLVGSQQGDTVLLYFASDLAYGIKGLYGIKPSQSITFKLVVDKIIK